MSNIITLIKDILAPKKCYWCQKQWHFLCPTCESKILQQSSVCYYCKQQTSHFATHKHCQRYIHLDQVIVYAHYRDAIISRLIKNGKFYNKKDVWEEVSKYYSTILCDNISWDITDYILVPVPMYRWKKYFRWYNQSQLLVKYISKQTGIVAEYSLVNKIKKTQQQSHLNKQQRIQNLTWSLVINQKILSKHKNKTIIIIDDVVSTWSTLNAISLLFKSNWLNNVIWCALASD